MASSMMNVELFESRIRKVVHEEMEQAEERVIKRVIKLLNLRTSLNCHVETSQGIGYQLVFADKLPPTIFTDSRIEAEMGGSIKIELVDTVSKAIVTSGPLSSMKIKIVVLDGDLGFEDQENWTEQEFDAKVVVGKKDKRPLVIGDLAIALIDGVGIINDLKFTHNSRWTKCGKFRLSARVVTSISGQGRIKEAISNAFEVKEYRGKMYEKHHPPSLDDDVCRLEKIGKGGVYHKRLAGQNIHKVKDFMQMYKNNPNRLKDVLKCTDGVWNTIVKHASTCVYDEKPHAVDGHNYQPPAKLRCIQEWQPLFERQNDRAYDLTSLQPEPISTPTTGLQHPEFPVAQQSIEVAAYNHPIQPSDFICGDNTRMEGLQATCNETTVTNLDYGTTAEGPMSTCFPACANLSCIQVPLVKSQNDGAYDLTSLKPEPISTSGLQNPEFPIAQQSIQFAAYNHPIQPFDFICGDDNTRMEGLKATCNETTITNLGYGTTAEGPMSTCVPVSANLPCIQEPLVESQNDRAYDLTSPKPEPISTPGMHMGAHHASTSSSYSLAGATSQASTYRTECPVDATFEKFLDDLIVYPDNE